ncbi:MAG: helix-turn-helix domain-containing GNAT family N-acetyltransferase [Caldilineaceae bacterium]
MVNRDSISTNESAQIDQVRRFNRFYTKQIGALHEGLLQSPFSLTEARVIYELAQHESVTASELCSELGIDPGYLSRIVRSFAKQKLIERQPSLHDKRQTLLKLSPQGEQAFATINSRSHAEIGEMLSKLPTSEQKRLVAAMQTIESILAPQNPNRPPYLLRPHQPGDMGWVIHRHGALYAEEYGWDETFEALVAEVAAKFINNFDPKHERCWIAEVDGEIVGSVFVVKLSDEVAKLRLLYVEPKTRGMGIGARLVDECIHFARRTGYKKMTLWTNNVLLAARHIYEKVGFQLVLEEPYHGFGHALVGETWELEL